MVYCGKASQGCQNCRARRIKCDKVKPECSQCIRVGKKCPGYRDQLSLMFRDESSKVIQKAHAQWGVNEAGAEVPFSQSSSRSVASSVSPASTASSNASSAALVLSDALPLNTSMAPYNQHFPASATEVAPSTASWSPGPSSPRSQVGYRTAPPTPPSTSSTDHPTPSTGSTPGQLATTWPPRLPTPMDPSLEEQGIQFYINRYLIGHPDEPKSPGDISSADWIWNPAVQDAMTAIGLASLSNLRSDKTLMTTARQRYGLALRQTGQLIQTSVTPDFDVTMRSVVMLAMFELVNGAQQGIEHVMAHIMGGVAILRRWCPMLEVAFFGARAMLQLCYSLFIPAQMSGNPLPAPFYEWINFSASLLGPIDLPATDLGILIGQLLQLLAYIQAHAIKDGQAHTASILQQLLEQDAAFGDWQRKLGSTWQYRVEKTDQIPSAAVFESEYHVYYDLWAARIWGHYRWARTLLNQTIVEFVANYPKSSSALVPRAELDARYRTIRTIARDTLVSTPSHWRHPLLDDKAAVSVEVSGGAGSGSAGIPVVLYHLKAAACAPGVPEAYWKWAFGVMECIWSDMGILHAKSMMEAMASHKDSMQGSKTDYASMPMQQTPAA